MSGLGEGCVREVVLAYRGRAKHAGERVSAPAESADLARRFIPDPTKETFLAILLNARHKLLGVSLVSVGTLTASLIHPREVFRPAVIAGACAVIVAHNHPSGDPRPSAEDIEVTARLARCGELLGITLLDHVIIGDGKSFERIDPQVVLAAEASS